MLCYVEYPLLKATSFPFFWINFVKLLSMVLWEFAFEFKIKPRANIGVPRPKVPPQFTPQEYHTPCRKFYGLHGSCLEILLFQQESCTISKQLNSPRWISTIWIILMERSCYIRLFEHPLFFSSWSDLKPTMPRGMANGILHALWIKPFYMWNLQ